MDVKECMVHAANPNPLCWPGAVTISALLIGVHRQASAQAYIDFPSPAQDNNSPGELSQYKLVRIVHSVSHGVSHG